MRGSQVKKCCINSTKSTYLVKDFGEYICKQIQADAFVGPFSENERLLGLSLPKLTLSLIEN